MERGAAERGMEPARWFERLSCLAGDGLGLCQCEEAAPGEPFVWRRVIAAEMRAAAFLALQRRGRDQLCGGEHVGETPVVLALLFERADRRKRVSERPIVTN